MGVSRVVEAEVVNDVVDVADVEAAEVVDVVSEARLEAEVVELRVEVVDSVAEVVTELQ